MLAKRVLSQTLQRTGLSRKYAVDTQEYIPDIPYTRTQITLEGDGIIECTVSMYDFSQNQYRGCVKSFNKNLWNIEERTLDYARLKMYSDEILTDPISRPITIHDTSLLNTVCLLREKPEIITECSPFC
jgi:hypothetical protein